LLLLRVLRFLTPRHFLSLPSELVQSLPPRRPRAARLCSNLYHHEVATLVPDAAEVHKSPARRSSRFLAAASAVGLWCPGRVASGLQFSLRKRVFSCLMKGGQARHAILRRPLPSARGDSAKGVHHPGRRAGADAAIAATRRGGRPGLPRL